MNEERWHNFAKEKPSEDMEGRNFIVSNGHYEKIATWCGYWENEPFMGDRLCNEVVRWKFYFTPEEEKASHYAEMVDAGMRERRLCRALYNACANWAACKSCLTVCIGCVIHAKKWERMYNKCRNKAEEYK